MLFDLVRGEPEKALEEILAIPAGAIPEAARKQYLAMTLHDLGRHEEADELSQEVVRALAETDASRLAQLAAYRGEVDRAFEWLDVAIDRRESGLRWVKTLPILANLHGDPRWQEFLGRMGLAD